MIAWRKLVLRILMLTALLALTGCIVHVNDDYDEEPVWRERQHDNQTLIQQMEIGTPIEQVFEQLGTADFTEAFATEEHGYRILRYRTHHRREDGKTTVDETTPLLFEDGRLVGWGHRAVNLTLRERGFELDEYAED